jgi:hypothetical protein
VRMLVPSSSIRNIENYVKPSRGGNAIVPCNGYEMDCPMGDKCRIKNGVGGIRERLQSSYEVQIKRSGSVR